VLAAALAAGLGAARLSAAVVLEAALFAGARCAHTGITSAPATTATVNTQR